MEDVPRLIPDMSIAEAGRLILGAELAIMREHTPALLASADEIAVHETRKAIRRSFTAVKQFSHYFEPGLLEGHRRSLRKWMRRLAPCRDLDVFLAGLEAFNQVTKPLPRLTEYWRGQKALTDAEIQRYTAKGKVRRFLTEYQLFTSTDGVGILPSVAVGQVRVKHMVAPLVQQRLAAVRAFEGMVESASLTQLHQLRIQFKELRYTVGFFEPLLAEDAFAMLDLLKQIQDLLGFLNDATVALHMLSEMPFKDWETDRYQEFQQGEVDRLRHELPGLWLAFDSAEWRRQLAAALAPL